MADGVIKGTLKNMVGMKVDAEPAKTNTFSGEAARINNAGSTVDKMVKGYAKGGKVTKSKFTWK